MTTNSLIHFSGMPPHQAFGEAAAKPIKAPRPTPISVRVSTEEKARIKQLAGPLSINAYVRSQLFGRRKAMTAHHENRQLGQVLGKLGQSHLSESFRNMADAARLGALAVTPEVELAIVQACEDVAEMKSMVMDALNIAER